MMIDYTNQDTIDRQNISPNAACHIDGVFYDLRNLVHLASSQADRIEELEKTCDEWAEASQSNYQRAKAAEAKLAKAVDALEKLARLGNGDRYGNSEGNMIARTTLAELKGQDDD